MSKNKSAAYNLDHWSQVLEGFAGQYDLKLEKYGDGIHWRLMTQAIVLDVWPTTGSYYVMNIKYGKADRMGEKGKLPWPYDDACKFLYELFDIPKEERM